MGRLITAAASSSNHHSSTTVAATNGTDSRQLSSIRRIRHNRNNNRDARSPVGGCVPWLPVPLNYARIAPLLPNFGDGAHHSNTHGFLGNTRDVNILQLKAPLISAPPLPPNLSEYPGFSFFQPSPLKPFPRRRLPTSLPPPDGFFPRGKLEGLPLADAIIKQIDYYFSNANLVNDEFLKSNMDKQGWVPIDLIASFPKVKSLTEDTEFILNSLRMSSTVEVQDKKLRKRYAWRNWVSSARNDSA